MLPTRKVHIKLILFFIGFVGLSILLSSAYHVGLKLRPAAYDSMRNPASVLHNDEGEPVFWDQSLAEVERSARRDRDLAGTGEETRPRAILSRDFAAKISAEEASRKTGLRAVRGRLALFQSGAFSAAVRRLEPGSRQRTVRLDLFNDVNLSLRLERPSLHSTNEGVYWGVVEGDEFSKVQMTVAGNKINATIETAGHKYQILDAGGQGAQHYVIEEDNSDDRH